MRGPWAAPSRFAPSEIRAGDMDFWQELPLRQLTDDLFLPMRE